MGAHTTPLAAIFMLLAAISVSNTNAQAAGPLPASRCKLAENLIVYPFANG